MQKPVPRTMTVYLREIGEVPLLTPQDEIELAARIKKGDKEARDRMIRANLRLVVKIAHDFDGLGLPLLDLISEGNIGLMKAVERFDPSKGAKLSTYSAWWIKQSIRRALADQAKTIRLPVHVVNKIGRMRRAELSLAEELGRDPTDDEVADKLDLPAAKIAHLRRVSIRPASLQAPLSDGEAAELSEIIEDPTMPTPFETLRDKTMQKEMMELLSELEPRETRVLVERFGLQGHKPRTLEEVGEDFHITRERIRQIQNTALAKLRHMLEELPPRGDGDGEHPEHGSRAPITAAQLRFLLNQQRPRRRPARRRHLRLRVRRAWRTREEQLAF